MSTLKAEVTLTCKDEEVEQMKVNAGMLTASDLFKQLLEGRYIKSDVTVVRSHGACDESAVKVKSYVDLNETLTIGEPIRGEWDNFRLEPPTWMHVDYSRFIDNIIQREYERLRDNARGNVEEC